MTEPLLAYDHVEVSYNGIPVVRDVSFPVMPGEVVCIVGESGSGKSTLVKAAMGQLGNAGMVTRGDIWYGGESIPDLPVRSLRRLCGSDFALVFQDCLAALTPIRRIGDQVHESLAVHQAVSRAESDEAALEMFWKLGLEDPQRVLDSYPFELSGGMGQRVGIAMALLSQPRVLFADEPTSALDVIVQAQVVELLRRVNRELGTTIVLVTHNMGVVRALADNVLVLKDGEAVEFGATSQVLDAPCAEYTRELLAATPQLDRAAVPLGDSDVAPDVQPGVREQSGGRQGVTDAQKGDSGVAPTDAQRDDSDEVTGVQREDFLQPGEAQGAQPETGRHSGEAG